MQEPIKAHIAIASTFTSPDVEYLDKAPITPIIESIPIIAPKDIDAGLIIFFMFNLLSSVVCFFIRNKVLIDVKVPTNKIKGKNIGHTKSEIDATIFSNCSKKEKIKKLNNMDLICPHCLLLSKI